MDCPFKIKLVISKDGNHLHVKELEKNHNHDIHEAAYRHLPRQQQLDEETKNEARKMPSLKANTKLIHCLIPLIINRICLLLNIQIPYISGLGSHKEPLPLSYTDLQRSFKTYSGI